MVLDFTEAIGTTPLCCPGRTSIVTGRYMHNHLVPHNQEEYSVAFDQSRNLQAYLGQPGADYFRGHIGRYLSVNTWLNPPHFDRWALSQGPYLPPIDVNEQGVRKVGLTGIQTYSTTYFKQQALQFLNEADQGGQTFFMHLGTYAPHAPFNADTPYNDSQLPAEQLPRLHPDPGPAGDGPQRQAAVGAGLEPREHLRHQPRGRAPQATAHAEIRRRPR